MTKLQEIADRLIGITPGPWTYEDDNHEYQFWISASGWREFATVYGNLESEELDAQGYANAKLISNAPTDIRFLVDFARAAEKALNGARASCSPHGQAYIDDVLAMLRGGAKCSK